MAKLEIKIAALICQDDRVLLIKEFDPVKNQYVWNLVKGSFEADKDKSLLSTLARECREEVNIAVQIDKLINIIYYRRQDQIRLQFNFLCQGDITKAALSNVTEQQARQEDIVAIQLFTAQELKSLKKEEFINERAFLAIQNFLHNDFHNISAIKELIVSPPDSLGDQT